MRYLRFNFTTGDAAGQNMVGKATYGGGTGLPTQQECLNLLGCAGEGKVRKLAEIIGATVLAGELSLISAVLSGDWVASHENLGRNR